MQTFKVIRGDVVCKELRFSLREEDFRAANYGPTRCDVALKLLAERGIEVEGLNTIMVIPSADESVTVVCAG